MQVLADALAVQFVRIGYVAINVRDLERSRAFYEAVTPMQVIARTRAPLQPFNVLGEAQGSFDGYLLDDGSGGDPTLLHLIEWQQPAPRGQADEVLERLRANGVTPANPAIQRQYVSIIDPDGVIISFLNNPQRKRPSFYHCVSGPSDPARTVAFYCDLFGLEYWMASQPAGPLPTSQGPGANEAHWDSHILRSHGDHRFNIDVSKILVPAQAGSVCPDPLNIGIGRIGIEVRDIDVATALIEQALAQQPRGEARLLGPVETWDLGNEVPRRKVIGLKDPDGMHIDIYQPERQFIASVPV
jgi:catechol 2,3-dioxygenase-like lactoylglutathione lyase family enzyme